MRNLSVTKKFRTETGHRLHEGYSGLCCSIHGHTFIFEFTVTSKTGRLDAANFVMELSQLNVVRDWLNTHWDHAVLLHSQDPLVSVLKESGNRVYTFPNQNPTIETMALHLKQIVDELLGESEDWYLSKIVVHETPFQSVTLEA